VRRDQDLSCQWSLVKTGTFKTQDLWLRGRQQQFLQSMLCQRHCRQSLPCALSLAAQCIVIGPVCLRATGGRAVSELTTPSARAVCVSPRAFFIINETQIEKVNSNYDCQNDYIMCLLQVGTRTLQQLATSICSFYTHLQCWVWFEMKWFEIMILNQMQWFLILISNHFNISDLWFW